MKKITLPSVVAFLCLPFLLPAQSFSYSPGNIQNNLHIGDYLKRTSPLGKFINYKSRTATLNDFKDKLVIFSFWSTHCGACIALFPKEDSLQQEFTNDIQIILVTYEPEDIVKSFLKKRQQKNKSAVGLPIIVEDTAFNKAMNILYTPQYTWVMPTGRISAQTSSLFINAIAIRQFLPEVVKDRAVRIAFDKKASQK